MKLWKAYRTEYSGYECDGHYQLYIIAAETQADVVALLREDEYSEISGVEELKLPDIKRMRKARIIL